MRIDEFINILNSIKGKVASISSNEDGQPHRCDDSEPVDEVKEIKEKIHSENFMDALKKLS